MRISKGEKIFDIINTIIILLICVVTVYPYLNQIAISLNDGMDFGMGGITVYPRKFTLENYQTVLSNTKISGAAVISVLKTIIGTVLALTVTFSAAYALTRKNLVGRKFITWFLCLPMYISAGVIPSYILYRYLGIINTFWVYVLPGMFAFYNMIIIRSFLQEIPQSLEESALIDGANEISVMFKIIVPLAMPVLATVALWVAVAQWNDWTTTLLYVTKHKLYPLQYIMMQIIKQSGNIQQNALKEAMTGQRVEVRTTPETVQAAVLVITTLPIVLIYPFLQRYFIKGVVLGAVKE